jgi:alpha-beta hydrolase superfamily lysophospholipase
MSAPPTPSSPAPPAPRFLYLQTGAPPMFAVFHAGAEPRRQRAVLLCPPFGWEDMCSYRSRRDWAEHLAAAGYGALRLDLPGSGDSAGGPGDPGRLEAWTQAAAGAARWLRQASDAREVVAVGIGLGGMVACRAALQGAPIDELVLWQVPARGRALVRELRAFASLEVAYIGDPDQDEPAAAPPRLDDGALVANGYMLSAGTVAELQGLDLVSAAQGARSPRRALLLGRDGLKVDERLCNALEQAGTKIALADGPGFGEMTVEPQEARPPMQVFELVDAWLEEGEDASAGSRAPSHVSAQHELHLSHTGVELRERPITIESPAGPLFGILTEPLGERTGLAAVLVNAGAQRHIGPNRMWVEIARRWAARGVPALRFDLGGIGDSDGDAAALAHVAGIYKPAYGPQMHAALATFGEHGLPERFVVLGLCAGGYWSINTALEDERVRLAILLNTRSLIWDEGVYGARRARELRERVLVGSTWRKALQGELNLARHLETARALAGRVTRAPKHLRARLSADTKGADPHRSLDRTTELARMFERLQERDQHALLLFTGREPLHTELAARGLLARMSSWPNIEIAIRGTSADTHTLTPLWLQQQVHELVDRALEQELARAPRLGATADVRQSTAN